MARWPLSIGPCCGDWGEGGWQAGKRATENWRETLEINIRGKHFRVCGREIVGGKSAILKLTNDERMHGTLMCDTERDRGNGREMRGTDGTARGTPLREDFPSMVVCKFVMAIPRSTLLQTQQNELKNIDVRGI